MSNPWAWSPGPRARTFIIARARSLTAEEEKLVMGALRKSSEFVYDIHSSVEGYSRPGSVGPVRRSGSLQARGTRAHGTAGSAEVGRQASRATVLRRRATKVSKAG